MADADVVSAGEAEVLFVLDEVDFWLRHAVAKLFFAKGFEFFQFLFFRSVIDEIDRIVGVVIFEDGNEAFHCVLEAIPVEDNDGDVGRLWHRVSDEGFDTR